MYSKVTLHKLSEHISGFRLVPNLWSQCEANDYLSQLTCSKESYR